MLITILREDSKQVVAKTWKNPIRKHQGGLSLPLDAYAGLYGAPDYGNITLCTSTPSTDTGRGNDPCQPLRNAFKIVDEAEGRAYKNLTQLIASWPRVWQDQLRLTHLANDTFSLSGLTLFTEGYGKNSTPFAYGRADELAETRTARFVISEGRVVGVFACGILRDTESVEGDCFTGEGARPGALVWFSKI